MRKILIVLFCLLFTACSDYYRINSKGEAEFVDFRAFGLEKKSSKIEGVDVATFKALSEWYAKDKNSVYWQTLKVKDANPETFKVINNYYGRDAQAVFKGATLIEGADPATFRFVKSNWTRDNANYYNSGKPLNPCDLETFRIIEEVGHLRAIDDKCYYWDEKTVAVNDFSTFELLPGGYAKDAGTVYFMSYEVPDADPATFEVKNKRFASIARDNKHCYSGQQVLSCDDLNEKGQEFCGCEPSEQ